MSGPISMYVPTTLIAVFSIPLALRLIPPNRFYGIRTALTLADRDVWYKVNRFAGFALILAAALATFVYLARPELASGRSPLGVLVLLVPLFSALAVVSLYTRALSRKSH